MAHRSSSARAGDVDVPGLLARFSQAHPGIEVGLREEIYDEAVAAFAPDRAPPGPHVTVANLARDAIVAPRRGSAITFAVETTESSG